MGSDHVLLKKSETVDPGIDLKDKILLLQENEKLKKEVENVRWRLGEIKRSTIDMSENPYHLAFIFSSPLIWKLGVKLETVQKL